MAAPRLTEGAITMITTDNALDLKPTLQVTELKQVPTKQPGASNNDRYRLVLSDGSHSQQAMLATQINHLVKDGHLRSGSIVQLDQYQCAAVQGRKIIIVLMLRVLVDECAMIGNPVRTAPSPQTQMDQGRNTNPNPQPTFMPPNPSAISNPRPPIQSNPAQNQYHHNSNPNNYSSPPTQNQSKPLPPNLPHYGNPTHNSYTGPNSYPSQAASYKAQHPPPSYTNTGPIAKNEAAPRIIPIAALNPYQGRWTIKARVTSKGEMRHYNNTRGDGKVFAFDLLDSGRGEIRVTCFNAVADQFFNQIEVGKVYFISRGSLKPAQKNFNHLHNDLEIFLEPQSVIQPCYEEDNSIPHQQFHFRQINEVEGMENNAVVDVIGVVLSVTPTTSIMRKNGTETQKRTMIIKDISGHSVEVTLWGNFCASEGQTLQSLCDSGVNPVLALKSGRVNDFNGKSVGTISSSQLFIDPDFVESTQLKQWFNREGRAAPTIPISKESSSISRSEALKTVSQIKDEKLGTSEKPDWISVNASVIFIKTDNFCYFACPLMVGDRPCSKKVVNNGDGKYRCERCDQYVDECDYRYILQFQIQDHTGPTWVTAFQESGEEIMGIPAKDLHFMKYENGDDDGFSRILRRVLFTRFTFKLKVKEETFSDEQRVKSTVVKAEKVNYSAYSKYLLNQLDRLTVEDGGRSFSIVEPPRYSSNPRLSISGGSEITCGNCGASGHTAGNCPSLMNAPGRQTGECFKCHQFGHWARDCPNTYGRGNVGGF